MQQDQWFVADTLDELVSGGRLLVDPNTFSADGTSSLSGYDVSRDGSLLAYQVSDGGSDWTTLRIKDIATGEDLDDVLTKVKFSEATWLPDGSFLYVHFPTEGEGRGTEAAALPARPAAPSRPRHGAGRGRRRVGAAGAPDVIPEPQLSHDGRWLVLHLHEGTSEKNRLWVYPVCTEDGTSALGECLASSTRSAAMYRFVRSDGDVVLLHTDERAPLGRVVRVDVTTRRSRPTDVVPESDAALESVVAAGDEVLAVHLVDAQPRLTRWSLDGNDLGTVDVDGGEVLTLRGKAGRDEAFIGMVSLTSRVTAYRLLLPSGELTRRRRPRAARRSVVGAAGDARRTAPGDEQGRHRGALLPGPAHRRRAVRAATDVPLRLRRLQHPGARRLPPGVRRLAGRRRRAGDREPARRQRVRRAPGTTAAGCATSRTCSTTSPPSATISSSSSVTTHRQLAIHGRSNGGLLVGATMLQRPDLAAVALPTVGVLDMLRFHRFTVGAAWVSDYGSPDDPEMFETLLAYSPLHNVVEGAQLPGDAGDDR